MEEKELMMGSLRQATRNTMFDQWLEAIAAQPTAAGAATAGVSDVAAAATGGGGGGGGGAGGPMSHGNGGAAGNNGGTAAGGVRRTASMELGGMAAHMPDPELARYLMASPPPGATRPAQATSSTAGVAGAAAGPVGGGGGVMVDGGSGAGVGVVSGPTHGGCGARAAVGSATVESSTFRPGWEDIFRMNQKQLEAAVMRVSADPHLEPGRKAYLIQNIMVSKYIVAQQKRMQLEQQQQQEEAQLLEAGLQGAGCDAGNHDAVELLACAAHSASHMVCCFGCMLLEHIYPLEFQVISSKCRLSRLVFTT
jgi:zinc finger-like protein